MCLKTLKRQYKITIFQTLLRANTVQKIKFSIKDSSVNVTKAAGNCGFGRIY